METQKKIEEENLDEEYQEIEMTPELEKYLREVQAGMHLSKIVYTSAEEMHRDILGENYLEEDI